jgi:hypothetical protein
MTTERLAIPAFEVKFPCDAARLGAARTRTVRGARPLGDRVRRSLLRASDGTLIWRDRWPGMDGSDDPYEGFMNMPLLYALGGSE